MKLSHNEKIHYAKINFEIAVCHGDFERANELEDHLSILFLNELVLYSEYINKMEKVMEERKKIFNFQKGDAPVKPLEEKIKDAREYYTKLNQEWIDVQTARELYSE